MRPRAFALCAVVLASVLWTAVPALAGELTVSAAASLTNAFKDLGALYEAAHPDTKVRFNFAASGPLLRQIEEGAPVDLFASADQETMDKAAAKKLVDAAGRVDFASNTLVLITPAGVRDVSSVADLAGPRVKRVAVGNPDSVPVGRYTREALGGLWDELKPKLVLAESVRQALDYVARGETEAGFVYASDAAIMADKVKVATVVPTRTPVTYPMAVVAESKNKAQAAAFMELVQSPRGAAVLTKYGFGTP